MAWFDDLKTPKIKTVINERTAKVPEGLWVKCQNCSEILQSKALKESLRVCPECGFHFRMLPIERIEMLCDRVSNGSAQFHAPRPVTKKTKASKKTKKKKTKASGATSAQAALPTHGGIHFYEYGEDLVSTDPLNFDDTRPYRNRLREAAEKTGHGDAFIAGKAVLGGVPYHLGVFDFKFMGGSMGVVVGEKIALVFENALKDRLPAVIVSASGGARMQEGILSLMQMAKTSALVNEMRRAGLPYISVLTDPTTGGVAASFAMLGDLILAEPKALIGFAGPRVIQQTIRQSLPQGFQRSEFLLDHGFVNRIVDRRKLPDELRTWMLQLGRFNCRYPKGLDRQLG